MLFKPTHFIKTKYLSILTLVASALLGVAQSPEIALPSDSTTSGTYVPTALETPVFTPPEPPVEKPIPTMRIDSAITVPAANSRTLTILRGEASDLPDIPKPVLAAPRTPRQLTPPPRKDWLDEFLLHFSSFGVPC